MGKDVIDVIEAAYRPEEDDQRWLDGILDAATSLGRCYGLVIRPDTVATAHGSHDEEFSARLASMIASLQASYSPAVLWAHHLPSPPVEHFRQRQLRIARTFDLKSRWVQDLRPEPTGPELSAWNSIGVLAGDACGTRAMALGLLDRDPPGPRERGMLARLSAHLTAALRIRAAIEPDEAAAVLDSRGRVLAADDRAAPRRTSLVEAVRTMDRARGRLRRTSPEEATTLWRAMVEGHWSLVDFVDRDGKRMILARENHPQVRDVRALTAVERSVVGYVALGHSNKHLAYELGLAPSTIASHLARALKKLRLTSRRDLIERFGPLAAESRR